MKTVTKCLFGGALVGAGLCSTAIAGGVDGVFTWNNGSAYVVTPFGAYSSHHTGGNFDISSDSPLGRAYARADQSGLTLFAESFAGDVGGYEARIGGVSVASVEAYFHVSQTMSVTMTWDFSADLSGGSYLTFDGMSYGAVGSIQLDLVAFESHLIEARMTSQIPLDSGFSATASTFTISNTVVAVPLPPAAFAGLGLLAGMGAYRRIRR